MEKTIAVATDPLFDLHGAPAGAGHPERPERRPRALAGLSAALAAEPTLALPARDATDEELCRAHSAAHVARVSSLDGRAGSLDADTYHAAGSARAARRAAGGAVALVDALLDGSARHGVAVVRPPGHHATRDRAMGFCLFNNVAVAACHARSRGAARVAIVDWDVHHGNGTEDVFRADPSVLFLSLHQYPFYPGTGALADQGEGEGRGATVNVPLRAGAGPAVYRAAFDRIVLPALERFAPELVLVSAGFDAHRDDPLGGMRLDAASYGAMTAALCATPGVPVGLLLEGGYDLDALEASTRAVGEALVLGRAPGWGSPDEGPGRHDEDLRLAEGAARQSGALP